MICPPQLAHSFPREGPGSLWLARDASVGSKRYTHVVVASTIRGCFVLIIGSVQRRAALVCKMFEAGPGLPLCNAHISQARSGKNLYPGS